MERIEVLKTYKIYIGGQFPRTESGRYYTPLNTEGNALANICLSSRKDLRNAVSAARKSFGAWSERAVFNRGQILYRIAEMLEGRKEQFIREIVTQGSDETTAAREVELSIDRLIYYAGWCDKYQQTFSAVNPVASSHFNFSAYEPSGVVGIIAPEDSSLLGLISLIAPVIAGGNTVIALASESKPLCAVTFAEVLHTSDLPAGVVNILTGSEEELIAEFGSHMDINALFYGSDKEENYKKISILAAESVKRVTRLEIGTAIQDLESPYLILDFQELKTTWHPIENIGGATSNY